MTFSLYHLLYNVLGGCLLITLGGPALLVRRWREGLAQRLVLDIPGERPGRGGECYWLHGASVGEVMAAGGLIEELLEGDPSLRLIVSTFTVAGREIARDRYRRFGERVVFTLLPLDWDGLPERALEKCRPSLFIILETELWPNLLRALGRKNCPLVLVNGRLSSRSFPRYRRLRGFFRPYLDTFSLLCVQTAGDAERFCQLGIEKDLIHVTGNVKHDLRPRDEIPEKVSSWKRRVEKEETAAVLVAGSLRGHEAEVLLEAFGALRKSHPGLKLVLAPRHPENFDCSILVAASLPWTRWSEMSPDEPGHTSTVVLVDTLGELADLYAAATVVFVGGTLGAWGGHNLMEPAIRGVPVLFGPDFRSFQPEAEALLEAGGGAVAGDAAAIASEAGRLLADRGVRDEAGRKAREVAESFGGAVSRTLSAIREVLRGGSSEPD